ncbi:MAG: TIGR03663 family protein [Verrucomicrobiota bacterium]|nr:TIGR03663 family protein [Verrucomicrobiota bacterium]
MALPDSLDLADRFAAWKRQAAATDWTPWIIVAVGAFLRVLLLGIKPPHFDEGINGWFVDQMTKTGFYRYDPTNYHGPLHFYILFLSQTLFGRNLWALRMPVVIGSTASIWLATKFEPLVGRSVSRLAAVAMALSPGFVFYGRYSIHEVWLLLFSMLFILGLLGLWRLGTSNYLWCAAMGFFGMILTKETYIIHVGCAAVAVLVTWISHKITPAEEVERAKQRWDSADLITVISIGLVALIVFYSGTFMNWKGVAGLYQTFSAWFATGNNGNGHEKPWYYWLMLIGRYETPIALGLIACAACQFFKNINLRYLAIYGVGTLAAYSIVHYKTPWCIISIVWPLLFLFAAGVLLLEEKVRFAGRILAGVALAVSLALCIRLNFFRCTTETEPYVYVQTYNDIWELNPIVTLARENPTYYQLVGHMIRTSAYPIPWILGDFPKVGYYEHETLPSPLDADFLLVEEDKIASVEGKLKGSYYTMPLRIRPYQDTSKLYLSARIFKDFFRGRVPDFVGHSKG